MNEMHKPTSTVIGGELGMDFREKVRLLSLVDILEPLSVEDLEWFARRTPTIHLPNGQLFYTPARVGGPMLFLLEGRVRVYKVVGGREFTLAIVDAGALSGEGTLTTQQLQGVYARTMEPSTAAIVPTEGLRRLVRESPEVAMKMVEVLTERLSLYGERMADIGRKSVRGRVASLIEQLVRSEGVVGRETRRIPTPYTHAEISTMVGAGRVAVTNAIGELRRSGCIDVRGRRIHVVDAGILAVFATDD